LKALLSDIGVRFRKTHEIGALMSLVAEAGQPLPAQFEDLDTLTPFGAIYRYKDYDAPVFLDRAAARKILRHCAFGWRASFRNALHRRLNSGPQGAAG
jgi:hypothetical protein